MSPPEILPALADRQWSLDGLVMGPGTRYNVQRFAVSGGDYRNQDAARPGYDGDRHGRDTRGGRTITLDLNTDAYTEAEGLAWARTLSAAWDAEAVRREPGDYQVLRWRRGQRVMRVYGRSRDFLPDHGMDWTGNVGATATFRTLEPRVYDDAGLTEQVPIVPDQVGGLVGSLVGDLVASGEGVGERGFVVGGDVETWAAVAIYGPIVNPRVEFTDQWSVALTGSLGRDEFVLIDPTPWGGPDVRHSSGANWAGRLTAASRPLPEMKLAPGVHVAALTGTDPTGTAVAVVYVNDCYTEH